MRKAKLSGPIRGLLPLSFAALAVMLLACFAASASASEAPAWAVQSTPNPTGATEVRLHAVSCASSSECAGVGSYKSSAGTEVTLAESWNGSNWTLESTPNPTGAQASSLEAVSCKSSCIATGTYKNAGGTNVPLAERLKGGSWSLLTIPNPKEATASVLRGVSCLSESSCLAVGHDKVGAGSVTAFAEYWDGTEWIATMAPAKPLSSKGVVFEAVSCPSASACFASGYYNASETSNPTLVEKWNGTEWVQQTSPNQSLGANVLDSISCTSTSACMAVGYTGVNPETPSESLAEIWNGTEWKLSSAKNLGKLAGVSCASASECVAVGASAQRYDGSGWEKLETASSGELRGVSCPSSSYCAAVGSVAGEGTHVALAEKYPVAPLATTEAAGGVAASTATLNGKIDALGSSTKYRFEYGETESYGTSVPVVEGSAGDGVEYVPVSAAVKGLAPSTTYHYRLVATNGAGTTYGHDDTLTTSAGPEWLLGEAPLSEATTVSLSGTVKLTDSTLETTVECEASGAGTASHPGSSSMSELTFSKCSYVKAGICEGTPTLKAAHLTWSGELQQYSGSIHDVLGSSGLGLPGFRLHCKVLSVGVEDECTASSVKATATNGASGVTATFDPSEKLTCNTISKGASGAVEGTVTIKVFGGKLEVI